jgi:metal-sulfur cluster biosynthetic enzyme
MKSMAVTRKQIMEKLSKVVDPELGLNIVDLGLIYSAKVLPKKKGGKQSAEVEMTFTTPACPLANYLLSQVESRLNELPDIDISVRVVFEPAWGPDRMSERAKIKLGMK